MHDLFKITIFAAFMALGPYIPDIAKYLSDNRTDWYRLVAPLAIPTISVPATAFWCLFVFRYLRLIVHFFSFWFLYKPTPIPSQPTLSPRDCSVILPTIDPENPDFTECIQSCLANLPGEIIIVTVGRNMAALVNQIVGPYRTAFPNTNIQVHFTEIANKRVQVAHGVNFATGKVCVLLDDHVFWPSANFLVTVLAPFEDDKVGAVGTNKRVRRTESGLNARSFWNMIGALYLERHNFEIRATNAIDGGVFVLSGRTAAYRTSILKSFDFMQAFTNERFFFGMFGPLNADDDNFLTRQVVARGYDIKIQYSNDAMIETTLGTYPKFLSQCLRWVRTTWRSNSAALFTDRTVWRRQPWCVYAVYLTSFVNFALFYDAALIFTLNRAADRPAVYMLLGWIFFTKMVKLTPYFIREPQDLIMLPGYFVFAYFHSLVKLYAGLTFWVTAWSGRNLNAIGQNGHNNNNSDDDNSNSNGHSDGNRLSSGSLTSKPPSSSSGSTERPFHPASEHLIPTKPTPAPARRVSTPWGLAKNSARTTTPANVLDSHLVNPIVYRVSTPIPTPALPILLPSFTQHCSPSLTSTAPSTTTAQSHSISNTLPTPPPTPDPQPTSTTRSTTRPFTYSLPRERKALGIPDTYTKSWVRGKQCQCLHSDRDMLFKTRSCRCLNQGFSGHQHVGRRRAGW